MSQEFSINDIPCQLLIDSFSKFETLKLNKVGYCTLEIRRLDSNSLLGIIKILSSTKYLYQSVKLVNVVYETVNDLLIGVAFDNGETLPQATVSDDFYEINFDPIKLVVHYEKDYPDSSTFTSITPSVFIYRGFRLRQIAVKVIDLHRFRVELKDLLHSPGIEYKKLYLYEDEAYNTFKYMVNLLYSYRSHVVIDYAAENDFESNTVISNSS